MTWPRHTTPRPPGQRIAPSSRRSLRRTARRWPSVKAWSASSPTIPRPGTTWVGRSTTSASCSTEQGHQQDALAMYRRAVEQGEAAFAKAPQVILYGLYLGTQYRNVASMLQALGRHDEAIPAYQRSVEHWRRLTRENPEVPVFRARLYSESLDLARLLVAQGRKPEAAEWFGLASRALEDQPRKSGGDLYNLACARALAAAAIGAAPSGPTAEDRRERDRLIAAAMDALRQSIEFGLPDRRAHADRRRPRGPPRPRRLPGPRRPHSRRPRRPRPWPLGRDRGRPRRGSRPGRRPSRRGPSSAREEPREPSPSRRPAASQHAIGQVLADLGRLDEAEKTLKEALAARERPGREEPGNVRHRLDAGWTRLALGSTPLEGASGSIGPTANGRPRSRHGGRPPQ